MRFAWFRHCLKTILHRSQCYPNSLYIILHIEKDLNDFQKHCIASRGFQGAFALIWWVSSSFQEFSFVLPQTFVDFSCTRILFLLFSNVFFPLTGSFLWSSRSLEYLSSHWIGIFISRFAGIQWLFISFFWLFHAFHCATTVFLNLCKPD